MNIKKVFSVKVFAGLFLALVTITGCNGQTENTGKTENEVSEANAGHFGDITVSDLKGMMERGEDFVLLDVRRPEEWAEGMISDKALKINFFDEDFLSQIDKLDKERSYVVYCAAGSRSAKATDKMKGMGFKKVDNLLGGYGKWSSQ